MILKFYCKSCFKSNRINSSAYDRIELSKEKGDQITSKCKHCFENRVYEINEINAGSSILELILFIISIIGSISIALFTLKYIDKGGVYSIFLLPVGIAIPFLLYFNWLIEERKKIKSFNKFKK